LSLPVKLFHSDNFGLSKELCPNFYTALSQSSQNNYDGKCFRWTNNVLRGNMILPPDVRLSAQSGGSPVQVTRRGDLSRFSPRPGLAKPTHAYMNFAGA
jgi:hypothetical protein